MKTLGPIGPRASRERVNPKIRKFDGNMCNGCGGGGLGGERGGDSGGDLSLKCRGGFRHPAKKNVWPGVCVGVGVTVAGVELNNNTALTIRSERRD